MSTAVVVANGLTGPLPSIVTRFRFSNKSSPTRRQQDRPTTSRLVSFSDVPAFVLRDRSDPVSTPE